MTLTVATVLKSGGVYGAEWVRRLRRQVADHLSVDHRFVCLTDADVERVETRRMRHDWPGYWSKLELYRGDLFDGRVIFFDLDTVIVGDISELSLYGGRFAALRDFYNPTIQASGVLAWNGRNPPPIYEIAQDEQSPFRGRSDLWWNRHVEADVLQDLFPGLIGSYKAHELQAGPKNFSVVCFHGKPRQHELPGTWVDDAWLGER